MSSHRVLLFARYAELLGAEEVVVELPDDSRVADVIAALRDLPGGASLPTLPFVAVNLKHAPPEQLLSRDDEVAILPPLAGG